MCKSCDLDKEPTEPKDPKGTKGPVVDPSHYDFFPGVKAIKVIASSMTELQFYGFCLGNNIKYRLRAGGKDDVKQELDKANNYIKLYHEYRDFCLEN